MSAECKMCGSDLTHDLRCEYCEVADQLDKANAEIGRQREELEKLRRERDHLVATTVPRIIRDGLVSENEQLRKVADTLRSRLEKVQALLDDPPIHGEEFAAALEEALT